MAAWNIAVGLLGVFVVVLVFLDVVLTAFSADGQGPLTALVAHCCRIILIDLPVMAERSIFHRYIGETFVPSSSKWKCRLSHWSSKLLRYLLSYAGVVSLLTLIVTWMALFSLGWAAIFHFDENNLIRTMTGEFVPIDDFASRLFYVSNSISSLGLGVMFPVPGPWMTATSLATVSGAILVTLLLSYLISITKATMSLRGTASLISVWGATPAEILVNSWDGKSFRTMNSLLNAIIEGIITADMQVQMFPISSHYISAKLDYALELRVVCVDEALTFLLYGTRTADVTAQMRLLPDISTIRAFKRTVNRYLASVRHRLILRESRHAPPPTFTEEVVQVMSRIERLTPAIPADLFDLDAYKEALQNPLIKRRRKLLKSLVNHGGNVWHSIFHSELNDQIRDSSEQCSCTPVYQVRHFEHPYTIEGGYKC